MTRTTNPDWYRNCMHAIADNLQHHVETFVPTEAQVSMNTQKRLVRELKITRREAE